jgi:ABC-type amino acid transport substrate-binding protein
MKRILTLCLAAILSIGLLTACAETKTPPPDFNNDGIPYNSSEDFAGKQLILLNTPGEAERHDAIVEEVDPSAEFPAPILADTLSDIISNLKSGRADNAIVFTPTAEYFTAQDAALGYTEMQQLANVQERPVIRYTVAMTTRTEDTELLGKINSAISEIKEDGTLDKLHENYIDKLNVSATDPIPVTDGAETIKVGITGDNPPFDYIDPSGNPQGFNVELTKAIAAKAGFNVEFIAIPSNARFAALESGRTDVHFFGTGIPSDNKDGFTMTEAYAAEVTMSNLYVIEAFDE